MTGGWRVIGSGLARGSQESKVILTINWDDGGVTVFWRENAELLLEIPGVQGTELVNVNVFDNFDSKLLLFPAKTRRRSFLLFL